MDGEARINTKTDKIRDKTGVWFYAGRSLLEPYGFPRDNGVLQLKLVKWLEKHNEGKIGADGYFITGDDGADIIVPADEMSIAFIIFPLGKGSTNGSCKGEQLLDQTAWEPILIVRSNRRKSKAKNNMDIAPDLLFNDYTNDSAGFEKLFNDLYNASLQNFGIKDDMQRDSIEVIYPGTALQAMQRATEIAARIRQLAKEKDADKIRDDFLNEAEKYYLDDIKIRDNFKMMVYTMAYSGNPLNEYHFPDLTNIVKVHKKTRTFVDAVKECVIQHIKANDNNIIKLKLADENENGTTGEIYDTMVQKGIKIISFGGDSNDIFDPDNRNGLSISIHDFWAYKIYITKYCIIDGKCSGKLRFEFYDHFGLDCLDLVNFLNRIAVFEKPGKDIFFRWFLLQHFPDYAYAPFITKVYFDEDF